MGVRWLAVPPVAARDEPAAAPAQAPSGASGIALTVVEPSPAVAQTPGLFAGPGEGELTGPVPPREEKIRLLAELDQTQVRSCRGCVLCQQRTQTVFGEGDVDAAIMFIGEGPGEDEDRLGRPFVGRAGQLLDRMITGGMGLRRDQVYIANVVKCRPPGNRTPAPDEVAACTPFLARQIQIIRPKAIVTLGVPATQHILKTKLGINKMRGRWGVYRGIPVMPTFHPSYVLRVYTPEVRQTVWNDLKEVLRAVGLSAPARGAGAT